MKSIKNIRVKNLCLYSLAALLPFCMMILSMAALKIAPFGTDTLVIWDAAHQYMDFIKYFRSVLSGENDLFYTFSKSLGGDMVSLAAYYLLSPFNILFAYSSTENLPVFYTMVVFLKLSLCGFSFYYASSELYGAKATNLAFLQLMR